MDNSRQILPFKRFPEFSGSGSWDYVPGNELFIPIVNKKHNSDLPVLAITQDKGAVPRELIDYNVIVSDKSIAGYKVVEKGDFIISLRSFQGGIEYSNYKGLCSPAYIVLRRKNDSICNDFYRHYFKSEKYIQDLNRNLEGIRDGKMISYQQFSEIKIPFPSLAEQKRIAECLSTIDEVIAENNSKLELLKSHKKGVMQQLLFPLSKHNIASSNTPIPTKRFQEFGNVKWITKTLEDIFCIIRNGANYNTKNSFGFPMSRIETISSGTIDFNRVGFSEVELSDYKMQKGDILFSHINSLSHIGKVAYYDGSKLLYHGMNLLLLRCKKEYCPRFVFQLLNTEEMKIQYQSIAKRAINQVSISTKELSKLTLAIPSSLEEQSKIADCLFSIDETIEAYKKKKCLIELYKNGLMQQLFLNK